MDIPYTVTARPDTGLYNAKVGIWLFLASEVMLFGGLFSSYIFLRVGADYHWPVHELNVLMGFINTLVLIFSSVTVLLAWANLKLRNIGKFKLYMTLTILCAMAFMVIKGFEYRSKFNHYAVKLTDGTFLTGHLDEGYEIKFGEATEFSLTITGENKAVTANPADYVVPYVDGTLPTFKLASGEDFSLESSAFKAFRKKTVQAAKDELAKRRQKLVDAGKLEEANKLNITPDTTVKFTASQPVKFKVKPSKLLGYSATTITFADGTTATGKLLDDRMVLTVDGVDTRSVPDAEKSLAWNSQYLGEAWKKAFVTQRDHANAEFKEHYPNRDPQKSATHQKHAYYLQIHGAHPPTEGAVHGAEGHKAEVKEAGHGDSHDAHEAHGPKVVLEKKDIAFWSNYTPKLNTYYAIYFTLTGLHGLHVIAGALVLTYFLLFDGKMLREDPERLANRVEVGGLFWHFVDLVWIFLFPLLYLL